MTPWRNSNAATTSVAAPTLPGRSVTTDEDVCRYEHRRLRVRPARTREVGDRPGDPVGPVAHSGGTSQHAGPPGAVRHPHAQAPGRRPPVIGPRARRALRAHAWKIVCIW